ncbi:hypothetical protein WDU94_000192 [Cyamophila willieti]
MNESISDRKGWASPQSILEKREKRERRKKRRLEERGGEEKEKGERRERGKEREEEDEDPGGSLDGTRRRRNQGIVDEIRMNNDKPPVEVHSSSTSGVGDLEKDLLESDLDLEDTEGEEEVNDPTDDLEESDGETIGSKFRRAAALPSDVEFDLESSQDGEEEGEEGEWSKMGAALEKEFGF